MVVVLTWEKSVMKGRLSRVHLHSLAFHAICQLNRPGEDYHKWSSDRAISAVAAGSLATTYQACASDKQRPSASILEVHNHVFEPHQFSEVITIELETYGSEKFETTHSFGCYVAPVLICKVAISITSTLSVRSHFISPFLFFLSKDTNKNSRIGWYDISDRTRISLLKNKT